MITLAHNSLAEFTSVELLMPRLTGDHRESVVAELSQRLAAAGRVTDATGFARSALEHEELAPAIFEGVAFAMAHHGRRGELCFAMGLAHQPIPWGNPHDGPRVRVVVLFALPATPARSQLPLVMAFCKFLKNTMAFASLRACREPGTMLEVLDQIRLRAAF